MQKYLRNKTSYCDFLRAPYSNTTHPENLPQMPQKKAEHDGIATLPSPHLYCSSEGWKERRGGGGYTWDTHQMSSGQRVLTGTTREETVGLDCWYLPAPYLGNSFVMGAAGSDSRKSLVHLAA